MKSTYTPLNRIRNRVLDEVFNVEFKQEGNRDNASSAEIMVYQLLKRSRIPKADLRPHEEDLIGVLRASRHSSRTYKTPSHIQPSPTNQEHPAKLPCHGHRVHIQCNTGSSCVNTTPGDEILEQQRLTGDHYTFVRLNVY